MAILPQIITCHQILIFCSSIIILSRNIIVLIFLVFITKINNVTIEDSVKSIFSGKSCIMG